jgi:branched-subunit amino acid transport protein
MNPRTAAETRTPQTARSSGPVAAPYRWLSVVVVAAGVGFWLSVRSTPLPGSEALTAEDGVDVAALLCFGALGAELLRRQRAIGLGWALLALAGLQAVNSLLAGLGDAATDGEIPTSVAARLAWMLADTAFIASFFLLVYAPLALFPTGRLPSRWWRWLPCLAGAGIVAMALSTLLAPGNVDDDNPATGHNPFGVDALADVANALEVVATALLVLTLVGSVAAYGIRWFRYQGRRRRQLAWFSAGAAAMVAGMVTDLGDSLLVELVSALVIFGTLLGGMAWPLLGPLGAEAEREDLLTRDSLPTPNDPQPN